MPGRRVSRTFLFGSSYDAESSRVVRSDSCFLPTRTPMSIWSLPELSMRSGGVPPLKRGWRTGWIVWVVVNLTFPALGKFFS